MDWGAHIRREFARHGKAVDESVVEELAQHAAAEREAALADGRSASDANAHVAALLSRWCEATTGPRRIDRAPLLESAPASRSWVAGLGLDVRNAFRLIRRQPTLSGLSVVMIALGVGVTSTLFSVVNGVLLKPLPWTTADRLVRVFENRSGISAQTEWAHALTNITYNTWAVQPRTIDGIGGWREVEVSVAGETGVERIPSASVTAALFPLLGESPFLGAHFGADDARANNTVIVSYGFWQERFGGASDVVGRRISLGGQSRTIIGVMRRGFEFPTAKARLWTPFELGPHYINAGARAGYRLELFNGLARLKPGVTPEQAAAEGSARLNAVKDFDRLLEPGMFGPNGAGLTVVPLLDWVVKEVEPALWILLTAGVLLFAAAIGTVVNLQLARAVSRRREIAIRSAIGAGTRRLARQLFVETITLSAIGGLLGLGLTVMLLRVLPAILPADFPRVQHIAADVRVVVVVTALTLAVSLAVGLLPVLMARRVNLTSALAEDGSAPVGQGFRAPAARWRGLIITAQVAVAALLLIGASLLTKSFSALLAADRGYTPTNVLTARVGFLSAGLAAGSRQAFYTDVIGRVTGIRGVSHAAFTSSLPTASDNWRIQVVMHPADSKSVDARADAVYRLVTADYFGTMGIRVLRGRGFTVRDTLTSEPVVVVNEAFVKRYCAGDPIGTELGPDLYQYRPDVRQWRIVGVVADVQHGSPVDPIHPELYATTGQLNGFPAQFLTVRTAGDPSAVAADVRAIVAASRNASLDQIMTMEGRVRTSLARPRLYAVLVAGFSAFAVVIAVMGLFGGLTYAVTQRTREIGVRSALGATPLDIVRMVMTQGTVLALAGLAIGLGLAAATVRYLSAFLFGVAPFDPATFVGVATVLLILAGLACAIPARRAATIDALVALKR